MKLAQRLPVALGYEAQDAMLTGTRGEKDPRTGRYHWVIFWFIAVQYLFVYFHRVCPAVVAPDLIKSFGISGAALGVSVLALVSISFARETFGKEG